MELQQPSSSNKRRQHWERAKRCRTAGKKKCFVGWFQDCQQKCWVLCPLKARKPLIFGRQGIFEFTSLSAPCRYYLKEKISKKIMLAIRRLPKKFGDALFFGRRFRGPYHASCQRGCSRSASPPLTKTS